MNYTKKDSWTICYKDSSYLNYVDAILEKKFNILEVLKDTDRSYVLLIELGGEKLVYKEPREKNRRKWQRFVNFFRGSDSFRSFRNMEKLENLDIPSTRAVMAVEKKEGMFVTDSRLLMSYLPGSLPTPNYYQQVVDTLKYMHTKGILHGDSQLANFIENNGKIYVIDNKPMENIWGKVGGAYEFIYLEESCSEIEKYFGSIKTSWQYKLAKAFNTYLHMLGRLRKFVKGKKV